MTEVQLDEARTELLERGILVCAPLEPEEMAGLTGEAALLLETTLIPAAVWVLLVRRRNSPARPFFYSFGEDGMVRNCVEPSGCFRFARLSTIVELADSTLRDSDVGEGLSGTPQPGQVMPLAEALSAATGVSVPLRVERPTEAIGCAIQPQLGQNRTRDLVGDARRGRRDSAVHRCRGVAAAPVRVDAAWRVIEMALTAPSQSPLGARAAAWFLASVLRPAQGYSGSRADGVEALA